MSQEAVYTFAKWQVKAGQLARVLEVLAEVAAKSRQEAGNLVYKIHQSQSDANTLLLFEGYRDMAAVESHRQSDYFQQLVVGTIVPLLENREVVLASELAI